MILSGSRSAEKWPCEGDLLYWLPLRKKKKKKTCGGDLL